MNSGNDHLLAERAIERMANEIDRALDLHDWANFARHFADVVRVRSDALTASDVVEMTRNSFLDGVKQYGGDDRVSFHSRSNTLVDVTGTAARLRSHYYAWNWRRPPDESFYELWGSLEYSARLIDGNWVVTELAIDKWRETGSL